MKAEKVADPDTPSKIAKVTKGDTVGVGCAEQGPDTCSDDCRNEYLLLLENFQNAQMRESAGEATTQGKCDPRSAVLSRYSAASHLGSWLTIELWLGITEGRHRTSLAW
jgi:hypothetical protein